MILDPNAPGSLTIMLSAELLRVESKKGRTEALGQAAGLVMGAVIALAELRPLAEIADAMACMSADATARRGAERPDIDAIPHPEAEAVHATSHHIARSLRQIRATSGDEIAFERATAALLAGSCGVRALTDGATLALLLRNYSAKAQTAAAMLAAGKQPTPQVFH